MDAYLKLLAEVGLAVTEAEEALGDSAPGRAEEALDRADDALAQVRAAWPAMTAPERTIIGRAATPLRQRLDAARRRLPARATLSVGSPELDPDEEVDPLAAA